MSDKGEKIKNLKGKITFKNVGFKYPTRTEIPVLKSLSLTIKPGQTVALVGTSGCGKSSLIQLIQRFYDTIQGEVCLLFTKDLVYDL